MNNIKLNFLLLLKYIFGQIIESNVHLVSVLCLSIIFGYFLHPCVYYRRINAEACTEMAHSISRMGEGWTVNVTTNNKYDTMLCAIHIVGALPSHNKLCYISKRVIWALSVLVVQHNGGGEPGWFDCVLCSGEIVLWKVQKGGKKEIRLESRWCWWFELNVSISVLMSND